MDETRIRVESYAVASGPDTVVFHVDQYLNSVDVVVFNGETGTGGRAVLSIDSLIDAVAWLVSRALVRARCVEYSGYDDDCVERLPVPSLELAEKIVDAMIEALGRSPGREVVVGDEDTRITVWSAKEQEAVEQARNILFMAKQILSSAKNEE